MGVSSFGGQFKGRLTANAKDATKKLSKDGCNRLISVIQMRALPELTGLPSNHSLLDTLASNDYIRFRQNVIINGATGCGKTWLADALGHTARLAGFRVKHYRVAQMLKEYERLCTENTSVGRRQYLSSLGKLDLLILDDWGIVQLDDNKRFSLYEIIENHMQHVGFIVTSVLPVKQWNEYLNDALMADSSLDRLVLNSHRLVLQGNSMRSRPEYGGLPKNDTEVQRLI